MVAFVVGRAVKTAEPVVTVDPGLPLGVHRFQLQVITADGRRSSVDVVDVSVQRLQILEPLQPVLRPTIIDPVSPVISPAATTTLATGTTISPTLVRTPRERSVRQIDTDAPPEPPAAGRKTRRTRRSES
ncbi:MAG: hypothetical protein JSR42_18845 [Proteobacteria bacterium]|nr:hypothetical protein [Pseudomonadota bacterium]